jgi:hypothetical protein
MRVRLLIHLERVPEGVPDFVWWAETGDVDGFSAAADHLPQLLEQARTALRGLLGEDPDFEYHLVGGSDDEGEGAGLPEPNPEAAPSPRVLIPA